MTTFADELMVRYMDPANVDLLLVPAEDATKQRAKALLAAVYEPRLLEVQSLDSITITAQSFQVPVVEPMAVNGTWEKVLPQSERSLIGFDLSAVAQTNWVDMLLETTVSARVSATSAPLDAVTSQDVSELSQQDFQAKFQFLDLPGLMTAAGVSTYQELQAEQQRDQFDGRVRPCHHHDAEDQRGEGEGQQPAPRCADPVEIILRVVCLLCLHEVLPRSLWWPPAAVTYYLLPILAGSQV